MGEAIVSSEAELFPPWKQLVSIAANWEYGTLYPHGEILAILGMKTVDGEYYRQVKRANKELTQIGKRIENVSGEGYMVVPPLEYGHVSHKYSKRSIARLREAVSIIVNTPIDTLSHIERSRVEQLANHATATYEMQKKSLKKETKILNAKPSDARFIPKNDRLVITDEST